MLHDNKRNIQDVYKFYNWEAIKSGNQGVVKE